VILSIFVKKDKITTQKSTQLKTRTFQIHSWSKMWRLVPGSAETFKNILPHTYKSYSRC